MPAIFTQAAGKVSIVPGQNMAPTNLYIDTGDLPLSPDASIRLGKAITNLIVTNLQVEENVNAQFMYSLTDTVHSFIFGDKLGQLTIGGVAVGSMCHKGTASVSTKSGLENIQLIYRGFKYSTYRTALRISVANVPYTCYLMGCLIDYSDTQNHFTRFSLRFLTQMR
jgi:hypothetical protein